MSDLAGLPGAERVGRGLHDLAEGRWSTDALLVAVAAGRLRALGLAVPEEVPEEPDLALYESLRGDPSGDPYYRYNALRRELDSFISCLETRRKAGVSGSRTAAPRPGSG